MREPNTSRIILVLLSGCLFAACSKNQSTEELQAQLEAEFQSRYIEPYIAGDVPAWMRVFADDAVALHDGLPPLSGKEAIRGFGDVVALNFSITKMDASFDEVRRNGDWAWTRGRFVAVFEAKTETAPPGVAGERHGKFLLVWERQPDGEWLVVMDMGNSIQPPPAEPTADATLYFPCQSCHGKNGFGSEALGAPAIAGMDPIYLAMQMRNFRDRIRGASLGDLEGRQMNLVAAIYQDDQQIQELANYVVLLPKAKPLVTLKAATDSGAELYVTCAACHGENGEGNQVLGGPAIAWLDDWYLVRQLQNFRDGERGADNRDLGGLQMRAAAGELTDDDIRKLASHVVTLSGEPVAVSAN